jgi:hypothetical protein
MGQRLAVFTLCILTAGSRLWSADEVARSPASIAVLAFFQGHATDPVDTLLTRLRPGVLDPAARGQVVASLPREGARRPTRTELEKIAAAERILNYGAGQGIISVKVIDLKFAFAGLYYRTVILVSREQLAILNADEFIALVAHEVGHDYDWGEYSVALSRKNHTRRQEL